MKEWPTNPKEVINAEDAVAPLLKVFNELYPNVDHEAATQKEVIYEGYNIGRSERAICPTPDTAFTPENFQYHKDRGREPIEIIFITLFQLGVEQGRRMTVRNSLELGNC